MTYMEAPVFIIPTGMHIVSRIIFAWISQSTWKEIIRLKNSRTVHGLLRYTISPEGKTPIQFSLNQRTEKLTDINYRSSVNRSPPSPTISESDGGDQKNKFILSSDYIGQMS